jgi:CO/xanthine dehydrogenase FAD-binding subunit
MGLKMEDVSPLAAMISGKGGMGKAMRQGFGGVAPMMIARSGYENEEEERQAQEQAAAEQAAAQGMKKGGKVKMSSASKRADGCATKGKTRGKMV